MKQLIFLFLLALHVFPGQAQNSSPSIVGIHSGLSWAGVFADIANHYNITGRVKTTSTPILAVSYDYKFHHHFSIGGGIARQSFSLRYTDYQYEDPNGNPQTDNFRTQLTRVHAGVRGLFHFAQSERKEFYTGLRVGIKNWALETTARDPAYQVADYLNYALGTTPSLQLILLGFRGYVTPQLGVNLEAAIGTPHFLSFGLLYRW